MSTTSTPTTSADPADECKQLGNKQFASKDYDGAIASYSSAIQHDPTNHLYFSNRSACYASLKDWNASLIDAMECVKICPGFIKGYYRLVNAQIEIRDFEGATNTVREGLKLDVNNVELAKKLREIKAKKANAQADKMRAASGVSTTGSGGVRRPTNEREAKEALELQDQITNTRRDLNEITQYIAKCQREYKMTELSIRDLTEMSEDSVMYKGVGKMFMKSDKREVMDGMENTMVKEKKKEKELTEKKGYLEKKVASQVKNFQELMGVR